METKFKKGDHVSKESGDYVFYGVIIAVMEKVDTQGRPSGQIRYAAQNRDGLIHIFSEGQLCRTV